MSFMSQNASPKTTKKPNINSSRPSNPPLRHPSSSSQATKNLREYAGSTQKTITTAPSPAPRTNSSSNTLGVSINRENASLSRSPAAHANAYRESFLSLKDDPFFRNYTSPQSEVLAKELRSLSAGTPPGNAFTQPSRYNMTAASIEEDNVGLHIELLEYSFVCHLALRNTNQGDC